MVHVKYISGALGALACGVAMQVHSQTFDTPSTCMSADGHPCDASAAFTTGAGTVTITLTNLQADPRSVGQNLSDLFFTLSNGTTSLGSLTSSTSTEVTVGSGGSVTPGGTVSTGWVLSSPTTGEVLLNVLAGPGHAGPAHTIIGPPATGGTYMSADGSIAANGPHNPFLNQTATFMVSVPGVSSTTTVTSATFSFGTTAGDNHPGTPTGVPEPASLGLLGLGLAGLGFARRRGRKPKV